MIEFLLDSQEMYDHPDPTEEQCHDHVRKCENEPGTEIDSGFGSVQTEKEKTPRGDITIIKIVRFDSYSDSLFVKNKISVIAIF